MRTVTHSFDTEAEADAFQAGVEWVNDSAITFTGSGLGDDGATYLVFDDADGSEDAVLDHRKEGARPKHHVERVKNDPKGYGDGLSDIYRCTCGKEFNEDQYGGAEEAIEHLEELLNA